MSVAGYGSDVIARALQAYDIPFVTMNPGASFRGLHDSLVNHTPGQPALLEVPHEKVAVGMAHGYAKVTGRPLAVVLHDLVGLLHGTLGVYYAAVDRVPMLVLGGSGPMDAARRRPWIDWIHTANVQNTAVRDFTKWDDSPLSTAALPDALERAYRVTMAEPRGPVYLAFDVEVQESALTELPPPPPPVVEGSRLAPDPAALGRLAELLVAAERPVAVIGYAGRDPGAFGQLIDLAELLPLGIIDSNIRLNFPNRHPCNVTGSPALADADVVLLVDVKDVGHHTQLLDKEAVGGEVRLAEGARLVDLGFGELGLTSWAAEHGSVYRPDLQVTADTALALPALLARCRELLVGASGSGRRNRRRADLARLHGATWQGWAAEVQRRSGEVPVAPPWLAAVVGDVVAEHDWVLTAGTANEWALRTWDFDRPYRHPGRSLGTATQIGISLGVALAHRGTGRLVVDLQPDGDLLFDASALWVATRHRIPLLVVMVNNRAYYNDWAHQEHIARVRDRPLERASIGVALTDPAPDFAGLARSFGWYAEGPIDHPDLVREAVRRAAAVVMDQGTPALVDVVCQLR